MCIRYLCRKRIGTLREVAHRADEVRVSEGGKAGVISRCKSGPGKGLASRLEASVA